MTVLGRKELIQCLRNRTLVVSPILSERQIGAASIDLNGWSYRSLFPEP